METPDWPFDTHRPCSGVYQIRNTTNGKVYLGGTVHLRRRFRKHCRDLQRGDHHSIRLQRAWWKYGGDAFVFEILVLVPRKDVQKTEQLWLDRVKPYLRDGGYNICSEGRIRLGVSPSPETRAKMSAAQKGRRNTPEQIERMRQSMIGKRHTEETKRKIGAAARLRKHTPEAKAKIGAAKRGIKVSPETRAKISAANKGKQTWLGRKHSEASKQKMSQIQKRNVTEERRERSRQQLKQRWAEDDGTLRDRIATAVSLRHKGKVVSEETKKKMSASMRAAWARRKKGSSEVPPE